MKTGRLRTASIKLPHKIYTNEKIYQTCYENGIHRYCFDCRRYHRFRTYRLQASSHRWSPAYRHNDPVADNTDLYVFRSRMIPIPLLFFSNYVPAELPQGGPELFSFGENVRYEVHIKTTRPHLVMTYYISFHFTKVNQDPTTFQHSSRTRKSEDDLYSWENIAGGAFTTIVSNGIVPPANIGPRSITGGAGLNAPGLWNLEISMPLSRQQVQAKRFTADRQMILSSWTSVVFWSWTNTRRRYRCRCAEGWIEMQNVHVIAIKAPISALQKTTKM